MDTEAVTALVAAAKYEFDHNAFTALKQAEFFTALQAAIDAVPVVEEEAAAPAPAPVPAKGAKK